MIPVMMCRHDDGQVAVAIIDGGCVVFPGDVQQLLCAQHWANAGWLAGAVVRWLHPALEDGEPSQDPPAHPDGLHPADYAHVAAPAAEPVEVVEDPLHQPHRPGAGPAGPTAHDVGVTLERTHNPATTSTATATAATCSAVSPTPNAITARSTARTAAATATGSVFISSFGSG